MLTPSPRTFSKEARLLLYDLGAIAFAGGTLAAMYLILRVVLTGVIP